MLLTIVPRHAAGLICCLETENGASQGAFVARHSQHGPQPSPPALVFYAGEDSTGAAGRTARVKLGDPLEATLLATPGQKGRGWGKLTLPWLGPLASPSATVAGDSTQATHTYQSSLRVACAGRALCTVLFGTVRYLPPRTRLTAASDKGKRPKEP